MYSLPTRELRSTAEFPLPRRGSLSLSIVSCAPTSWPTPRKVGERHKPAETLGGGVWESKGVSVEFKRHEALGFAERGKSNANSDGPGKRYRSSTERRAIRRQSLGITAADRAGWGRAGTSEVHAPWSSGPSGPRQRMRVDDKAVRLHLPDGSGKLRVRRGIRLADECPNARYEGNPRVATGAPVSFRLLSPKGSCH